MTVRPRRAVHRGSVEAMGVIVTDLAGGELAARRRIVAVWRPGATVFALADDAWLVRWPAARRLRCERAPGLPVAVQGSLLTTAPLADDELAALAAPPGALVWVRRGACEVVIPTRAIDPAGWLDVDEFARVDVASLGDPPRPAAQTVEPAPPPVRALFKELVGAPPAAAREVAAALHARRSGGPTRADEPLAGRSGGPARADEPLAALLAASARRASAPARTSAARPAAAAGAGALAILAAAVTVPLAAASALGILAALPLLVLAGVVARVAARKLPARTGSAPAGPPARPPPPLAPAPPPAPSRLREALRRLLERAGLTRALDRDHARYLRRMIDMFERGDYPEALRHAIPLGSEREGPPAPPALGRLSARQDLQIRPAATAAGSSLRFGQDDFDFLRQLYRRAFERLVAQGRIDEAAFLLAELLHADEEAVAFLERHGRGRLAAEIAEARGLPPGLVVRQWFLAGDRERAVRVARRRGAFADAVARLERDPERRADAAALRLTWADLLAAAGDYEVAVEVAAPVPEARSQIRGWMDLAIARGGRPGARMLARKLQRFPDDLEQHRDLLVRLTDPAEPAHADARAQLLEVLVAGPAAPAVQAAARPLIRALVADAARGERTALEARVRQLALALGDDALRVDLPRWPTPTPRPPLATRAEPLRVDLGPGDVGAIAVHDVALLPDGALLVALGELGARLLDPRGRVVWHADQPATSLVLSDHGDRAIAVVARGPDVVRLARLDLARRRASAWCEARLARWAADYDGQTWVVAETSALRPDRARLVIVDALAGAELRALDHRDLELGPVREIVRGATSCVAVLHGPEPERWRWDLPDWTLRRREPLPGPPAASPEPARGDAADPPLICAAESRQGERLACHRAAPGDPPALHRSREGQRDGAARPLPGRPLGVAVDGAWAAIIMAFETCLEVHVLTVSDLRTRAVVALVGSARAVARFAGEALAIADDRGRVLALDLRDGALSRSLRTL